MAILLDEAFETGPDATAIDNINTALTSTTVPAGAVVAFDASPARDNFSAEITTPGTYAATFFTKSGMAQPALTDVWFRWYAFYTDFITPAQSPGIARTLSIDAAVCCNLRPTTAGLIQVQNSSSTIIAAGNGAIPIAMGQWVRIEMRVRASITVGQIEWWLYNTPDATVETETKSVANQVLGADLDGIRLGQYASTGHAGVKHNYDDFAISTTGKIGPAVPVPKAPPNRLRRWQY